MEMLDSKTQVAKAPVITSDVLLNQWLGHRRLTRRVIEAFPEKELFHFSVGGMRPFAQLIMEILRMGAPGIRGVVTGTWASYKEVEDNIKPATKAELLRLWDEATEEITMLWPQISANRFQETDKFLGLYEGPIYWSILYLVDNEIHHRGQGYVYLRSLGIVPPYFWDRN